MAVADQKTVRNLTKFNMIFTPEIQPQLLDFVNDAVIGEILTSITRYLFLAEQKEHYKHAFQKAGEIVKLLSQFQAEAKIHLKIRAQEENGHKSATDQ